jgi:hypothetical protein
MVQPQAVRQEVRVLAIKARVGVWKHAHVWRQRVLEPVERFVKRRDELGRRVLRRDGGKRVEDLGDAAGQVCVDE